MYRYLVALGSNLGDRKKYIDDATEAMPRLGITLIAKASDISTDPIGNADQQFLNSAIICEAPYAPEAMLETLLSIELNLGRVRTTRWGNRTIDLDIIMALDPQGTEIVTEQARLRIPHPHALERDFVMIPAAEIAGDWIHPLTGRSLSDHLEARKQDAPKASSEYPQGSAHSYS